MKLDKIPATVVTGFLGSGKTTLLSNVIRQANGKRIAVIVNEFGEMDIDAELLRSCPLDCEDDQTAAGFGEDGIYELANGCICCTVEEEFLPVIQQLVERRDSIDHILIETSGLALPKPLVQAMNWPEIRQHCTVDSVITVVDGPALADGRIAHDPDRVETQRLADDSLNHDPSLQELLEDQLSSADMVIISKADRMDGEALATVQALVRRHVQAEVKVHAVSGGEISSALVIGLELASETRADAVETHHDHYHEHGQDHRHAHDYFNSVSIELGEVHGEQVAAAVSALIREHGVFRVKGFLALPEKPMRQVFHAVGERVDHYFDRLWRSDEARHSRLVFIGRDLEPDAFRAALKPAELHPLQQ